MSASGDGAAIYFIAFVLLVNFVLVNLFIMIILDNFEETNSRVRALSDDDVIE